MTKKKILLPEVLLHEKIEGGMRFSCRVPENLHYLKGHFTEAPITPGVVQIKWVRDFIRDYLKEECEISSLSSIKFVKVLLPGDSFFLEIIRKNTSWNYRLFNDSTKFSSGKIQPS